MIRFNFNKQKAIEAALYIANKRPSIDKISLYKFLFFADCEHLNKYGRPIFGGYYVALDYGPVPSQLDKLLKQKCDEFYIDKYLLTAKRTPNLKYLSQSDIEVLDQIYNKYDGCSARKLSDISHSHPAWKNAREYDKTKNNNKLNYRDMIEDDELIEELEESSKYILI